MPKTKLYTVYTFDELSDSAKERARAWYREGAFDHEWWDYEDAKRMAALLGIEFNQRQGGSEPTIFFSGFSSQGDGACFEGHYHYAKGAAKAIAKETNGTETVLIGIAERLQEVQRKAFYRIGATVTHSGHYYHEYSMTVAVYDVDSEYRDVPKAEGAEETVIECMRDFARWIYRSLEAEYEYLSGDEQVDESITANEYTFDEDGNRED